MRIKMRSTRLGSPDGVQVNSYEKGETYRLPDELGLVFLREGWAERAKFRAKAKAKAPANKNAGAAPENKASGAR